MSGVVPPSIVSVLTGQLKVVPGSWGILPMMKTDEVEVEIEFGEIKRD